MEKLDKIMDKLVEVSISVAEIRKDVARNTDDLAEHIKRTDLRIELIEQEAKAHNAKLEEALTPIRWLKGAVALCSIVGVIIGLIAGIKGLI
jgi:hypothetical protein